MRWFAMSRMTVSLALAVLAACALFGINELAYQHSAEALAEISQAQRTRADLNRLLQHMLDAETGQRGYLLTGDPQYLEPYVAAVSDIKRNLDSLRQFYRASPPELAILAQLADRVARKLSEMDVTVQLRQRNNEDAWKFVITTDVGHEHMEAIREQSAQLIAASTHKMALGEAQITQSLQLARVGIAVVSAIGLLAFYLYLRQTNALKLAGEREQESLQRERDRLEQQVRERTESLVELATHLQQVREDERGHLARELHDELGSLLTAAKLDVARLKSRLPPDATDAGQRLLHLTGTLNSGIALSRRIVEDLRPSSLSHLGLVASLEILAREFGQGSGLAIATELESVDLVGAEQLTVYRLVQESLNNIAKYAQARQVAIRLQDTASHVVVEVRDDGKGFDPARTRPSSHGLAGMRHRVQAAGGQLTVESAEGRGTRICARLPKLR